MRTAPSARLPLGRRYSPLLRDDKPQGQSDKGMIDLAYRSGEVSTIQGHTVYANDEFDYSYGLNPTLIHKPAQGDRGEPTHFYGMYKMKDGVGYGFAVMSIDEVRKHSAKYSEAVKKGYTSPWSTNFEAMAIKSALKRALKYAPMKTEFARALAADETVKTEISADMYEIVNAIEDEQIDQDTGEVLPAQEVPVDVQ